MKKILLVLTLLFSLVVSAQDFWTEATPFGRGSYYAKNISIADESTVWVTGTDDPGFGSWSVPRWGRSTDGGLTWTSGFLPDDVVYPARSSQFVVGICAISNQTPYFAISPYTSNSSNKILVTHDAGDTWTQIHPELFSDAYSHLNGIHFFDNNHGIVYGDLVDNYFEIYTTADAAATWTRTPPTNIPPPLADEFPWTNHFDATAGILRFMTNKYRLFSSYDQGLTWTVSQTPDNSFYDYGDFHTPYFSFKDANEGLLVTAGQYNDSTLYRTTDGGITWIPFSTTGRLSDYTMRYVPQTAGTYYNTGEFNDEVWNSWGSGYSTDDGNSWTAMTENQNFKPMATKFLSPTIGYAVGYEYGSSNGHGFYRLTDTFNRLLKNKSLLETSFNAAPNPTKDTFRISGSAITSIAVHDVTGKAIYHQSFAATDQAEVDLSAFRTGIYFAKVSNDNGSKTIKIIKD